MIVYIGLFNIYLTFKFYPHIISIFNHFITGSITLLLFIIMRSNPSYEYLNFFLFPVKISESTRECLIIKCNTLDWNGWSVIIKLGIIKESLCDISG